MLIALGVGIIGICIWMPGPWNISTIASFPLIGAGLLTPFKRPWTGAAIGLVAFVLLILVSVFMGGLAD